MTRVFLGHHMSEVWEGPSIAVPTAGAQCDLCVTSLEYLIEIYFKAYRADPTTVLYARVDRNVMHNLRYSLDSTHIIRTTIRYWIELPLNNDTWAVVGEEGMVLSEGA